MTISYHIHMILWSHRQVHCKLQNYQAEISVFVDELAASVATRLGTRVVASSQVAVWGGGLAFTAVHA